MPIISIIKTGVYLEADQSISLLDECLFHAQDDDGHLEFLLPLLQPCNSTSEGDGFVGRIHFCTPVVVLAVVPETRFCTGSRSSPWLNSPDAHVHVKPKALCMHGNSALSAATLTP